MQKYLVSFIIFTIISSCSSVSTVNQVVHNDIHFRGGVVDNSEWDDVLVFRRTSWFYETKMINDLLIAKLEKSSPFYKWLGTSEDQVNEQCSQFYVAITRSNDFRRASRGRLMKSIADKGFKEMLILNFHDHIRAHAAYSALSLESHRVIGFCSESKMTPIKNISIQLPGFADTELL